MIVTSVFTKIGHVAIFAHSGDQTGHNGSKRAHLLTNGHKRIETSTDMQFHMRNMIVASLFTKIGYLAVFGHSTCQSGHNGSKCAYFLTNGHKMLEISSVMQFHMSNMTWNLFLPELDIWSFFAHSGGQTVHNGSKRAHLLTNGHTYAKRDQISNFGKKECHYRISLVKLQICGNF